ncbi:MAG: HNH endonuclease, partial [Gammaproteobacteria bacterium]
CGICGRTLPTQFLIAAHIKDRWHCTKVERMDYENIAMPMCKFGCEQLYRRNYITVIDERVAVTKAKVASNDLKAYLVKVRGRVCPYWRGSEAYFNWHTRFGSY